MRKTKANPRKNILLAYKKKEKRNFRFSFFLVYINFKRCTNLEGYVFSVFLSLLYTFGQKVLYLTV